MKEPLVSIIIPVYNGSNYMREAIDSALAQTYRNKEIIVVNDGSKDGGATHEIARSYGDKIRYFSKENGGVSSALNFGIRNMKGEYFSWLSHDDVYTPDKLEKQIAAINQKQLDSSTLVYCTFINIDANSNILSSQKNSSGFVSNKLYQSEEVLAELLQNCTFNGCGLLIPVKALTDSGLFDERLRFCQDAFMWYKIFMQDYSLFCIDDTLVKNRIHSGQLTQRGQQLFRKECEEISHSLVNDFSEISSPQMNFLEMYLLSDARYFDFGRVKSIIKTGKKKKLISNKAAIKAYFVCMYGHIRPIIRRVYYFVFKGIKTT